MRHRIVISAGSNKPCTVTGAVRLCLAENSLSRLLQDDFTLPDACCLAPTGNSLKAERNGLLVPFIIFRGVILAHRFPESQAHFFLFRRSFPFFVRIYQSFSDFIVQSARQCQLFFISVCFEAGMMLISRSASLMPGCPGPRIPHLPAPGNFPVPAAGPPDAGRSPPLPPPPASCP